MKKLDSESLGQNFSRQQWKGTELLSKVHTKASIFIMDTPGHFSSQISLAGEFSAQGFETLALINNGILKEFLEFMAGKGYVAPVLPKPSTQSVLKRFMPTRQRVLSMGNTWNFLKIQSLEQEKAKFKDAQIENLDYSSTWKRIQSANQKSILVWPEFNFFYGHLSIFRLLTKAKIAQAIYTYSLVNEEEWKVALAKNVARTRGGFVNRIIDLAFPAWTRSSGEKEIRLPLQFPIAAKLAAYHTYNPWLAGANLSIPIFTPDSFTFSYLQKAGYDAEHLHIGGMTGGGRLISIKKSKPSESLQETRYKNHVLIALPPDQTCQKGNQNYRKLISATILNSISKFSDFVDFKFVLHPRLDESSRDWFTNLGFEILDGELSEHIARTDVYIACASATLRIAESLGVPAINYDIYKFRYADFDRARFVMAAEDPIHFEQLLQKLLKQPFAYEVDMAIGISPAASIINFLDLDNSSLGPKVRRTG